MNTGLRLRDRAWRRFIRGPDRALLDELYVPALRCARRYDRACAYFSSSVLAAAARGFGPFLARLLALGDAAPRPAIRLLVNVELAEADVRALVERGDTNALECTLVAKLRRPRELLERHRFEMLAWLAQAGLLEVQVGVMRSGAGIFHGKFGIVTDEAGDAIVFSGSGNETGAAMLANYEALEVSTSWDDPERYAHYRAEFERFWANDDADVVVVPLPEAVRQKLIRFAPAEPPLHEPAPVRERAALLWRYLAESPFLPEGGEVCDATALVDLWPHQRHVAAEASIAWPDGRLLCDEVGLGKTLEAIAILRRLMAGRGVRRALLLVPAGLLRQWQSELREKGGLVAPRLEGQTLIWPDDRKDRLSTPSEAFAQPLLLVSREWARLTDNRALLLSSHPWDLVILDEAHAARRAKPDESEFNSATLLLELLRQLQLRGVARSLLLVSATPMQTYPWEPWDLLAVLGEGGVWLADFSAARRVYQAAKLLETDNLPLPLAQAVAAVVCADRHFPPLEGSALPCDPTAIANRLAFATTDLRLRQSGWLRRGAPLGRRMHRNTRAVLRRYAELGALERPPARREITDCVFDFAADSGERAVYEAITDYIDRRYADLEREKRGKGFVMTIYRRRAASSPAALRQSLERRAVNLRKVAAGHAVDPVLADDERPDTRSLDELGDESGAAISAAYPSTAAAAQRELEEVERLLERLLALGGIDSKRDRFYDVLRDITSDGRPALVFTEYVDTMTYLRDWLVAEYGTRLGCFSGDGAQQWDGTSWRPVTKDAIAQALATGRLTVLLCTDAASEGLNLQAAGALINYDLPWNPAKVEQRIGRIDRIGQRYNPVRIVNLFLRDSVDERVYTKLRERCGLFDTFVGPMQPVLARARRMLLGQERLDLTALDQLAEDIAQDIMLEAAYQQQDEARLLDPFSPVLRDHLRQALAALTADTGIRATGDDHDTWTVHGLGQPTTVALSPAAAESDRSAVPLTPLAPLVRAIADALGQGSARLPLVVGACERGSFRSARLVWLGPQGEEPITSFDDLDAKIAAWDGRPVDAERWLATQQRLREQAQADVEAAAARAAEREQAALQRQVEAARLRLQREVGRFLLLLETIPSSDALNRAFYVQMCRKGPMAARLRVCHDRFGGYPHWPEWLVDEVKQFVDALTPDQRRARLAGNEIQAALDDPRWTAAQTLARKEEPA